MQRQEASMGSGSVWERWLLSRRQPALLPVLGAQGC